MTKSTKNPYLSFKELGLFRAMWWSFTRWCGSRIQLPKSLLQCEFRLVWSEKRGIFSQPSGFFPRGFLSLFCIAVHESFERSCPLEPCQRRRVSGHLHEKNNRIKVKLLEVSNRWFYDQKHVIPDSIFTQVATTSLDVGTLLAILSVSKQLRKTNLLYSNWLRKYFSWTKTESTWKPPFQFVDDLRWLGAVDHLEVEHGLRENLFPSLAVFKQFNDLLFLVPKACKICLGQHLHHLSFRDWKVRGLDVNSDRVLDTGF